MFNFKRFFLLTLSFIISLIIPRSKNIIVVGSRDGKRFADNSRYLFYYLNKEKKFKIIWLTKSKKIQSYLRMQNFEVLISNSAIGLYYGFRAKYHIFDYSEYDTSEFSSMRAHKINLGHGIYIKKVTSRVKNPNFLNDTYNYFVNKKNFHIYPNKKYATHILNYFPKNKYKLIVSNFTRNIFLHDRKYINWGYTTTYENKILKRLKSIKGKRIGYFPTWRKDYQDLFLDLKNYGKLKKLNDILKKNDSFLVLKHHSNHFKEDSAKNFNNKDVAINFSLNKLSNFINLNYDTDLNTVMCYCDLLISDYSGAIIDYLITNRPIILYTPDIKKYEKDPGLFFNYNNLNFSHKAVKYETLINLINEYLEDCNKFSKKYYYQRKRMKNIFFENNSFFTKITNLIN